MASFIIQIQRPTAPAVLPTAPTSQTGNSVSMNSTEFKRQQDSLRTRVVTQGPGANEEGN